MVVVIHTYHHQNSFLPFTLIFIMMRINNGSDSNKNNDHNYNANSVLSAVSVLGSGSRFSATPSPIYNPNFNNNNCPTNSIGPVSGGISLSLEDHQKQTAAPFSVSSCSAGNGGQGTVEEGLIGVGSSMIPRAAQSSASSFLNRDDGEKEAREPKQNIGSGVAANGRGFLESSSSASLVVEGVDGGGGCGDYSASINREIGGGSSVVVAAAAAATPGLLSTCSPTFAPKSYSFFSSCDPAAAVDSFQLAQLHNSTTSKDNNTAEQQQIHCTHPYNGIFLVDGLGQGVRIENQNQRDPVTTSNMMQQQQMNGSSSIISNVGNHGRSPSVINTMTMDPSLHTYGLPNIVTSPISPIKSSLPVSTHFPSINSSSSSSCVNAPAFPSSFPSTSSMSVNHVHASSSTAPVPAPISIRIDAGSGNEQLCKIPTQQRPITTSNFPPNLEQILQVKNGLGLAERQLTTVENTHVNSSNSNNNNNYNAIISVVGSEAAVCNNNISNNNNTSVTNLVPNNSNTKTETNSVVLPVPSPSVLTVTALLSSHPPPSSSSSSSLSTTEMKPSSNVNNSSSITVISSPQPSSSLGKPEMRSGVVEDAVGHLSPAPAPPPSSMMLTTTRINLEHQNATTPAIHNNNHNNNHPRTLISTEAQTDTCDFRQQEGGSPGIGGFCSSSSSVAPPPPPSRNNREQRKRERRERRRGERPSTSSSSTHHHNNASSSSHRHYHSGDPAQSSATNNTDRVRSRLKHCASSSSQLTANTTAATSTPENSSSNNNISNADSAQQQPTTQVENNNNNGVSACATTPNNNNDYSVDDSSGLPDLLNSHLPPPYSTLPSSQNFDRRFAGRLNLVPLHHPHPHPLVSLVNGQVVNGAPLPHAQAHMQIPLALPPPPPPPPPAPIALVQQHQAAVAPPPTTAINCIPSPVINQPTVRYHFPPTVRASRRSLRARGMAYASEEEPKSCCGMSTSQAVSIRWFVIVIAVIGICCTVAGTALGAAHSNGREHLTLSLLMIGVGVVLLTVSAVAWRLTANDNGTSCRSMLGFARNISSGGDGGTEPNRRFIPRLAPSYGRPHHPYAAMMYPDFQYRPPPPSYQASMQEYRLRLLLLERSNPTIASAASVVSPTHLTMVPPPAYRPYGNATMRSNGTLLVTNDPDYSRPPSYRSRISGNLPGGADCSNGNGFSTNPSTGHHHHINAHNRNHGTISHHVMLDSPLHSRDPSLLSYLSQQSIAGENVSIVGGGSNGGSRGTVVTVMQAVSVGMDLGLDISNMDMEMMDELYDPNDVHHLHHHHNIQLEQNDENKSLSAEVLNLHCSELGGGSGEKGRSAESGADKKNNLNSSSSKDNHSSNKDGNLVRIVQTTDSSQVIARDSVIVTVSGSNQALWDQSLQHVNRHQFHHVHIHQQQPQYSTASLTTYLHQQPQNQGTEIGNNSTPLNRQQNESLHENNIQNSQNPSANLTNGSDVQILAHL